MIVSLKPDYNFLSTKTACNSNLKWVGCKMTIKSFVAVIDYFNHANYVEVFLSYYMPLSPVGRARAHTQSCQCKDRCTYEPPGSVDCVTDTL